jgi:hypothetical protein
LPANFSDLPPRYLRTPDASRFVGLSIRTLEKHRIYGTGPRYSAVKASTSDPGKATVLPAKRQTTAAPMHTGSVRR